MAECSNITLFGVAMDKVCRVSPKDHSTVIVSSAVYNDLKNGQNINDMDYLKSKIDSGEIYPYFERPKYNCYLDFNIPKRKVFIKGTNQFVYI